ncbi:sulfate adenylyltransferase (ADP) / ATP adenylyltransferase, partial [Tremellales sp. Uapishka_1]
MAYPTTPSTPAELLELLPSKFEAARKSGQLFFFPSQAKSIESQGRHFNLRICPALLDKAKALSEALAQVEPERKRLRLDDAADKQNKEDPFKPPYVEELYVGCLKGLENEKGMSILLNKYSLLPEHFLLCPPTYQPQSLPPTPHQLALAHSILVAASKHPTNPRRLLAFYNGGSRAGASQNWRHIQFVDVSKVGKAPVEEWVQGLSFDRPDRAVIHPSLPHLHIVHQIPPASSMPFPPTEESSSKLIDFLGPALMKLLDIAFDALRNGGADRSGGWNLLMTLDHLHLIPRSAPSFPLPPQQPLELNALGYAGLFLVRSEEEEQALMAAAGDDGLMGILKACAVPREWGDMAVEAHCAQNEMINVG